MGLLGVLCLRAVVPSTYLCTNAISIHCWPCVWKQDLTGDAIMDGLKKEYISSKNCCTFQQPWMSILGAAMLISNNFQIEY